MRNIKFRVWDKDDKVMFKPDGILKSGTPFSMQHDEVDYMWGHDEFELMQYIGLKDKNGKEIYEGDIVKIYKEVDNLNFTGKVIFKDASFAVQNDFFTGYCWQDYEVEVIENIFEENDLWKYE